MIQSQIIGNNDKKSVDITQTEGNRFNSLIVSTEPRVIYDYKTEPFYNSLYGVNMNQDFVTGSVLSTENIHNGEDNTYWTPSIIVGNINDFHFDSTDIAHTGTQSINCSDAEGNDQFQLTTTSLISQSDYHRLGGWVYVTSDWGSEGDGCEIVFHNSITGLDVSNILDLDDYINGTDTGVWQHFNIALSNFGTFDDQYDSIRFKVLENGSAPNFYLDDIVLEELSINAIGLEFKLQPPNNKWWYVDSFQLVIAAEYDATLLNSTIPKIPYDSILGVSITNGINYRRIQNKETLYSVNFNTFLDIMTQPGAQITGQGFDGTNTWIAVQILFHQQPLLLKGNLEDRISLTFNDDFSDLLVFRTFTDLREVDITKL